MQIVVGPVLTRQGGYAFDCWTPEQGLSPGYTYGRVEDAYYARKVEIRSPKQGRDAEIHRLRGELTGRLPYPDPAKAEDSFRTALGIAREQGTRGYELRAATSLACLWREQGRLADVRDLIAPVYGSFTEGFDTADLKEAKRLLDQLT